MDSMMMMVRDDWERIIFPGVFLLLLVLPVVGSAVDLPDLVVTGVTFSPAHPVAGDTVRMTATVMNQGTVAKLHGPLMGVMFLVDGQQINYRVHPGIIHPGSSIMLTGKVDPGHIPAALVPPGGHNGDWIVVCWTATEGSHTIEAVSDCYFQVDESDESNNNFVTTLEVADSAYVGQNTGSRQYNLRGVQGLGDGAFQTIDAICQFTPYLEVQVRYSGHLNDVAVAYERDGMIDQRITYGASGNYGMHLVNPTGKIHIQAQKWSGDQSNGKPIKITVTNCYGKVLYEGQTAEDELDVYLTMKGCDAEEFAAWMAANGPKE